MISIVIIYDILHVFQAFLESIHSWNSFTYSWI